MKYRERFFRLADMFLNSPLLPAYLVAAFIKKTTRLALKAPPSGIAFTLPFVYNLLRRHPNCMPMIHRIKSSGMLIYPPSIYKSNHDNISL